MSTFDDIPPADKCQECQYPPDIKDVLATLLLLFGAAVCPLVLIGTPLTVFNVGTVMGLIALLLQVCGIPLRPT